MSPRAGVELVPRVGTYNSFYIRLIYTMFIQKWYQVRVITVFAVFRLLTDFVCLYNYEFWLSLCKIVPSSVILLLPLFPSWFEWSKRFLTGCWHLFCLLYVQGVLLGIMMSIIGFAQRNNTVRFVTRISWYYSLCLRLISVHFLCWLVSTMISA